MDSVQITRTSNGGLYVVINGYGEGIAVINNLKFKRRGNENKISIIGVEDGILFTFDYASITLLGATAPPTNINDGVARLTDLFSGSSAYAAPGKFDQTITFAQPAARPHTDPAFSANASVTSGLPLAYLSSDPTKATVHATSGLITPVAAGTTNITVSQAGDANYNAAVSVVHTITLS